ncbi:MAG TPA: hypothetical protein VHW02_01625 [Rhizomicrobium sp.]|jgi:hypothetical protein|nr:hypothetical protein [Rhizomicrobium sp.]
MKTVAIALSGFLLSSVAANADTAAIHDVGKNTCLWSYMVDHTSVAKNSRSIVFHMRDGKQVLNTLPASCNGLQFHGFSYVSRSDEVCAGQGIRVIETGQVCMLGQFSPSVSAPDQR